MKMIMAKPELLDQYKTEIDIDRKVEAKLKVLQHQERKAETSSEDSGTNRIYAGKATETRKEYQQLLTKRDVIRQNGILTHSVDSWVKNTNLGNRRSVKQIRMGIETEKRKKYEGAESDDYFTEKLYK